MMTQKKYLFVTIEGGGNLPPVLDAVKKMLRRGHDVRVLAEPCLEAPIVSIGARFVPFSRYFRRTDRQQDIFLDWQARSPVGALKSSLHHVVLGPAAHTAADVDDELERERADALVVDWLLPAAIMVGEARRIPTAVLMHCVSMLPARGRPPGPMAPARGLLGRLRDDVMWSLFRRLVGSFGEGFNAVRAARGLSPLDNPLDQYARADRILMQTTEAFDFPAVAEARPAVYVGPSLDDPDWVARQTWQSPFREHDQRPLVVLSLSSTFQNQEPLLQLAIDALGELDVRALVTTGPAMKGKSFAHADNVVVVEQAPHTLVFQHTAALVSHCGHGSIMRALAQGVPIVAVPMGRDQDANATRIVARGLGVRAKKTRAGIRQAIERVLSDPAFRAAAGTMAARIHTEMRRDRLGEELHALTSTGLAPAA